METTHDTASRTRQIRDAIARSGIRPDFERPCPYLADRLARNITFKAGLLPAGVYQSLMDLNFRRSGHIIYQPACRGCTECRTTRVPVDEFKPDRTQRRCLKHNAELRIEVTEPRPDDEKHELYRRYLAHRHDRQMDDSFDAFEDFLYQSPVETVEVTYRLGERLVAVGLVDLEPQSASTVYCYFDPALPRRSLGTFNVLHTIELCRRWQRPHLYLGYYVRDCAKMSYKASFRPCELLQPDGTWQRHDRPKQVSG